MSTITPPRGRATARYRKTSAGIAALALTGAALISGAPGQIPAAYAAESTGSASTNLKIALTTDIDTLNPFEVVLAGGTNVLGLQYEALTEWSAKDNTETAGISDKWSTSPDGKVWTFDIPDGRKWSDGQPQTAKDAAYSFNAVMTNEKLQKANGSLVENFASVAATDDNTLVITLKQPQAPNPGADLPVVPQHIWEKLPDPSTFENAEDSVGSGPFIVKKYDKTAGVTMTSNPNFWRGKAKVSGITWVPYKSMDAAVQALKTGEVDFVNGLTPAQFNSLKDQPGITTNAGQGRRYQAIGINPGTRDVDDKPMGNGNPVLQDPKVRQAIIMGIDPKTLLEKVLDGLGQPATAEIPAYYPKFYWDTDPASLPYAFNPDKANQLLDEAGYKKGSDGIRAGKDGKPISLRLMGRSTDPTHQQMAEYIIPWMKDIGITVKSEMKAPTQVNTDSVLGDYDMYFTGWGIGPDPDFQLSINQCSSRPNSDGSGATSESNWCSPAFDALYTQQHAELDPAKRAALVIDAQKEIYNAAVNNVLYYANSLEAYRSDKFTGFAKQPSDGGVISAQNGYWGYYSATPVASASSDDGGPSVGLIIGIVAAVIVVAGGITLVVMRRRKATSDDRE